MTLPEGAEPILDLGYLAAQTFADRALQGELLELFEQQCRRLLPIIADGGAAMNRDDAAHTLKGAARAVGAGQVAALAETLERLAWHRADEAGRRRLLGQLDLAVQEVAAAIAAYRQGAA